MNAKPSRNTKATIAAAAREEFARLGYAGARVERITRRAGVNNQLIFYYFGSKRGLYDSVVQGAAHGVLRGEHGKRDDPGAATDGLRRAVQQLFDDLQAQPDVTALLLHDARDADGRVELAGPVLSRMLNRISKVVGSRREALSTDPTGRLAGPDVIGASWWAGCLGSRAGGDAQ